MNKRGNIKIRYANPITSDKISILFLFEGEKYKWVTSSWRSGKNPIPYSSAGETFDVSFTVTGKSNDIFSVNNVRILKQTNK